MRFAAGQRLLAGAWRREPVFFADQACNEIVITRFSRQRDGLIENLSRARMQAVGQWADK